jgi:chromosomal replication initiation ATPase DnaA
VSDAERAMAQALGNQFTYYVGGEDIVKQNPLKPKKQRRQEGPTEAQKLAFKEKMKKLDELRRKTYLSGKYSFQRVLEITCAVYCITEEELLSSRRFARLVRARQQLIYIMRKERGLSFLELGRRIGGRDHSTIIHSYRSAENNRKPLQEAYEEIMEKLSA